VLGLSRDQLADLARNSVHASFLDAAAKQELVIEIDAVASRPEDTSADTPG
jgi:adenosine deaminase